MKPSRPRRNSSVPLPLPSLLAPQRRQRALASSLPLVLPPLSSLTSTFRPTRFYSCGKSPTIPTRRVCHLSLVASTDSRKSDWFLVARVLHSSSMRLRQELLAQRRLLQVCPWANRAKPFALPTRDSSCFVIAHLRKGKYILILFCWRLGALILLMYSQYKETT